MFGFDIFVVALLILFVVLVMAAVKIVPQGYNFMVERVEGPDLPRGARIKVVGADGTLLKVEAT